MKRFFKGFVFALIAILSFTLISCKNTETPCEHDAETAWKRDSSGHWHACKNCDELLDFSLHTMSDYTKIENECKEKTECTTCGYSTTRTIAHKFVDGLCEGCGLEEGNYEVEQFYVRVDHNSWGSPDEDALKYDPKTKTASITITLEEGKDFKVAPASWDNNELNFGFENSTFEEGLFITKKDGNLNVVTTAEYIITVSGYDTGVFAVEIKIACLHKFGEATLITGETCKYSQTCSTCNAVVEVYKHDFKGGIVCDKCGYNDLATYYVRGTFNNFDANPEYALELDSKTYTATVDLWLQVGHSFKIATDDYSKQFNYDNVTFTEAAKAAFVADGEFRNIYCVAKGADALGVKFTVTISGLDTQTHTLTIDTKETYTVEDVEIDIPTANSDLYLVGSMNNWSTSNAYLLNSNNGVNSITIKLNANATFKVKKGTENWDVQYHFLSGNLDTSLFAKSGNEVDKPDILVLGAGTYKISVDSNGTLSVDKIGEYTCTNNGEHTFVAATCTVAKHCSVANCGYVEGNALGHDWDTANGVESNGITTYKCKVSGCDATKDEITDVSQMQGLVIYLSTSVWDFDDPVIWVHAWNAEGSVDKVMTRTANGQFVVQLDAGYTSIIFVRGGTGSNAGDWDHKWNQTGDLTINGNTFTIDSWDTEGSWSTVNH